ncbi:MAG: diacylglycerol kinase [Gammaproteobacteria bacterium]|nr:MAG: diacylglycerol kinase [Gammaproteobacteria bacterium]
MNKSKVRGIDMNIEMNKYQKLVGMTLLGAIVFFGIVSVSTSAMDERSSKDHQHQSDDTSDDDCSSDGCSSDDNKYTLIQDDTYALECGSCHLAYPAELLPSESWHAIMTGLDEHFDESAEMDEKTTNYIYGYLKEHALDKSKPSRLSKMLRNLPKKAPLRITDLPYFIHEHDEIPNRMVTDNPKVGSFSNCEKCHEGAAGGQFDEENVNIPGFAHWDD